MPQKLQNITYSGVCGKCSQSYLRDVKVEDESILNNPHLSDQEKARGCLSNTQKVFCPTCIEKFKEWMSAKGYLETGCWCGHIEEYKKEKV